MCFVSAEVRLGALLSSTPRITCLCGALLVTGVFCGLPSPASAQLRSLHALRYVTLTPPPPGAEQLHRELSDFLRQQTKLLEPSETLEDRLAQKAFDRFESVSIEPRARFGQCRLRMDLPAPRVVGLQCSDYAGQHVGLVRFSTAAELQRWVRSELRWNFAAARPLNAVRYLASGQSLVAGLSNEDRAHLVEYVTGLLRSTNMFTVVGSEDSVSVDQRESLVWFDLNPSAYALNDRAFSRLSLKDRFGNVVRSFEAEKPRSFSTRGASEAAMRALMEQLARARAEDEDIYRALQD